MSTHTTPPAPETGPTVPSWLVTFRGLQPEDIGIAWLLSSVPPVKTYTEAAEKISGRTAAPTSTTQIIASVAKLILAYEHQGEDLPPFLASLDGAQ